MKLVDKMDFMRKLTFRVRVGREMKRLKAERAELEVAAKVIEENAKVIRDKYGGGGSGSLNKVFRKLLPLSNSLAAYNDILENMDLRLKYSFTLEERGEFLAEINAIEKISREITDKVHDLLDVPIVFPGDKVSYIR